MSLSLRAEVQKIGMTVPAARAFGRAAASSCTPMVPSVRYFSIRASSTSTMASTSCERAAARSTGQPAGVSTESSTPTTPLNLGPGSIGALNSTQPLPKVSRNVFRRSMKWILSPSSLLTTRKRARPRRPASANMRRVLTSMPLTAETTTTTFSTAPSDPRAAPMKSG